MNFEAPLAKLSERADIRGREFERPCKWFLQSAPEYRSQVLALWLWEQMAGTLGSRRGHRLGRRIGGWLSLGDPGEGTASGVTGSVAAARATPHLGASKPWFRAF